MVKVQQTTGLDFMIDKLTNSIENVVTGDIFATDLKTVLKKKIGNLIGN